MAFKRSWVRSPPSPPCRRKRPIACGGFFTKVTGALIPRRLLFRGTRVQSLPPKAQKYLFMCLPHIKSRSNGAAFCYIFHRIWLLSLSHFYGISQFLKKRPKMVRIRLKFAKPFPEKMQGILPPSSRSGASHSLMVKIRLNIFRTRSNGITVKARSRTSLIAPNVKGCVRNIAPPKKISNT